MGNNRVLAIDDDPSVLDSYIGILAPKQLAPSSGLAAFANLSTPDEQPTDSFDVVCAQQGLEGIKKVQEHLDQEIYFAAILIDMRMPPGIDGLETARRIRELDDRAIIFIVTAYSDRSIDEIQKELKHDVQYLRKPVSQEVIYQMVRDACIRWDRNLELEWQMYYKNKELYDVKEQTQELEKKRRQNQPAASATAQTYYVDGGGMPGGGESWLDMIDG
ncbi:MAG: response regulator [Magnetococcales bacterium]|nr:response regulator [Magnetococcales bacterium]